MNIDERIQENITRLAREEWGAVPAWEIELLCERAALEIRQRVAPYEKDPNVLWTLQTIAYHVAMKVACHTTHLAITKPCIFGQFGIPQYQGETDAHSRMGRNGNGQDRPLLRGLGCDPPAQDW